MLEGVTQFDVGRNTQFDVGRNYSVWCWKELLSLMLEGVAQFGVAWAGGLSKAECEENSKAFFPH